MKKFVLLFVSVIAFVACSENSVSENQNLVRREGVDLESLYLSMIQSESYINAEIKLRNFVTKMNFEGDISEIDTEAKMFLWISANLSGTHFSSLPEAQAHWNSVKTSRYISFTENRDFYDVIDGRENEFRDLILIHDPAVPQPVANSVCDDNLQTCTSSASGNFVDRILEILGSSDTPEFKSKEIALARGHFIIAMGMCADSYVDCVLGAPQE